jgi:hypothetical protein
MIHDKQTYLVVNWPFLVMSGARMFRLLLSRLLCLALFLGSPLVSWPVLAGNTTGTTRTQTYQPGEPYTGLPGGAPGRGTGPTGRNQPGNLPPALIFAQPSPPPPPPAFGFGHGGQCQMVNLQLGDGAAAQREAQMILRGIGGFERPGSLSATAPVLRLRDLQDSARLTFTGFATAPALPIFISHMESAGQGSANNFLVTLAGLDLSEARDTNGVVSAALFTAGVWDAYLVSVVRAMYEFGIPPRSVVTVLGYSLGGMVLQTLMVDRDNRFLGRWTPGALITFGAPVLYAASIPVRMHRYMVIGDPVWTAFHGEGFGHAFDILRVLVTGGTVAPESTAHKLTRFIDAGNRPFDPHGAYPFSRDLVNGNALGLDQRQQMRCSADPAYTGPGAVFNDAEIRLRAFGRSAGISDIENFTRTVVALRQTGQLPPGLYLTQDEARARGWRDGEDVCAVPGLANMRIGGGVYENRERNPDATRLFNRPGRNWREADIDYRCGPRDAVRLLYSEDRPVEMYLSIQHYQERNGLFQIPY